MNTYLSLDLATTTGWAVKSAGIYTSGTQSFKGGRHEGGGMRFLRFKNWLVEMIELTKPDAIFYEEVRRHMSTDAAHVHGGLLAVMQSICEGKETPIPYIGIPVGTIKKQATGKGNAGKPEMISSAKAKWPDQSIADDNQADALWILETGLKTISAVS